MQEKCYEIVGASLHHWNDGLPDELAGHADTCSSCAAFLEVSYGVTVAELRERWRAKEPERMAEEKFRNDFSAWLKTWRGMLYGICGGPFWSRRAKWLGIPQRRDP